MTNRLINKHIILGVTGGIAAYKSADLARRLREAGAVVRVVMTQNAKEFITPLTLQAVSGNPVHDDVFDLQAEAAMGHIALARWADAILVAPATADFMARLCHGEANDLLTTLCLATTAPIAIAPAMNQHMWENARTQENKACLAKKGIALFGPAEGSQACGEVGFGRMSEPMDIVKELSGLFVTGALAGKRLLITAGPTQEAIDPMRYITNASSGKMGYALAEAAIEAGAYVTLISGPTALQKPEDATCIDVVSAIDMHQAVMEHVSVCDIFIGVAAVGDYRAKYISPQKIAKKAATLTLHFERNPDIIADVASLSNRPYVIGFAAESEHVIVHATEKLQRKHLDMIIANQIGEVGIGARSDDNAVTVITNKDQHVFPRMRKDILARELITYISKRMPLCNQK